jgi:hypothetical protein
MRPNKEQKIMAKTQAQVLKDIEDHPEKHKHTFQELIDCCTINGKVWHTLMTAHAEYCNIGEKNGRKCDVISGCCSCGAIH